MFDEDYEVLGLTPGASDKKIEEAYRFRAARFNPNRDEENWDHFLKIVHARQTLCPPEGREHGALLDVKRILATVEQTGLFGKETTKVSDYVRYKGEALEPEIADSIIRLATRYIDTSLGRELVRGIIEHSAAAVSPQTVKDFVRHLSVKCLGLATEPKVSKNISPKTNYNTLIIPYKRMCPIMGELFYTRPDLAQHVLKDVQFLYDGYVAPELAETKNSAKYYFIEHLHACAVEATAPETKPPLQPIEQASRPLLNRLSRFVPSFLRQSSTA